MDAQADQNRQVKEERRGSLRRLDDLLQALESLNLLERTEVPDPVLARLREIGVGAPEEQTVPQLIERVWEAQTQYLIAVPVERRQYRRRRQRNGASTEPWTSA